MGAARRATVRGAGEAHHRAAQAKGDTRMAPAATERAVRPQQRHRAAAGPALAAVRLAGGAMLESLVSPDGAVPRLLARDARAVPRDDQRLRLLRFHSLQRL